MRQNFPNFAIYSSNRIPIIIKINKQPQPLFSLFVGGVGGFGPARKSNGENSNGEPNKLSE